MLSVRLELQHNIAMTSLQMMSEQLKQNRIESGSMPCRTEEEVWSQEPQGQVVMVTEDHWEENEILKRASEFHKIGS